MSSVLIVDYPQRNAPLLRAIVVAPRWNVARPSAHRNLAHTPLAVVYELVQLSTTDDWRGVIGQVKSVFRSGAVRPPSQ